MALQILRFPLPLFIHTHRPLQDALSRRKRRSTQKLNKVGKFENKLPSLSSLFRVKIKPVLQEHNYVVISVALQEPLCNVINDVSAEITL